jgi:hypothetical protein
MTRLLPPFVATARGRLASSSLPQALRFVMFLRSIFSLQSALRNIVCFPASARADRPRQNFGCGSTKLVMRRLFHAASFAIRRAIGFRNREANPRTAVHAAASPTSGEAHLW